MVPDGGPLVSVVMTVFNGELFLRRALDSILGQTYDCFELIVVDDASTDSTVDILAGYPDARLVVVRNAVNLGPYGAANAGLKRARGEYIARHDADDISHPERLEKQVAYLQIHPKVGLLHTDYRMVDAQDRELERVSLPTDNAELQKRLVKSNIFVHGTIMVRRALFEAVGGYREFFPVSQDYDLYLRIAELAELANLPEPLYGFRFHSSSISRTKRALQLACKSLAWSLAANRRAGLPEGPIPEDVIAAFPPDPKKLFLDARGISYLYYASGQTGLAEEAVHRALDLDTNGEPDITAWESWGMAKAHHLADMRQNATDGEDFLSWLAGILQSKGVQLPKQAATGRFYADRAFKAQQAGQKRDVRRFAGQAFRRDPRWMRNAGLWKICLQSMR